MGSMEFQKKYDLEWQYAGPRPFPPFLFSTCVPPVLPFDGVHIDFRFLRVLPLEDLRCCTCSTRMRGERKKEKAGLCFVPMDLKR